VAWSQGPAREYYQNPGIGDCEDIWIRAVRSLSRLARTGPPAETPRRCNCYRDGMKTVTVYGADWCPLTKRAIAHLEQMKIDFRYIDIDQNPRAARWVREQNGGFSFETSFRNNRPSEKECVFGHVRSFES